MTPDILHKINKLSGKTEEEQYKIIWGWIKQNKISFAEFMKVKNWLDLGIDTKQEG